MFKKISLVVVPVLLISFLVFAIVVALQPDEFVVTRSGTIEAQPAAVFPYVNDLRKLNEWSPWARLDPNIKNEFSGPEAGEGAKFHWVGNENVGEGIMTITESRPVEEVTLKLEFIQPMAAVNSTKFTLKPEGNGTVVTWTMSGENNFMGKAFCLVMNMDKIIGDQFEQGLANMKSLVESPPADSAESSAESASEATTASPTQS